MKEQVIFRRCGQAVRIGCVEIRLRRCSRGSATLEVTAPDNAEITRVEIQETLEMLGRSSIHPGNLPRRQRFVVLPGVGKIEYRGEVG